MTQAISATLESGPAAPSSARQRYASALYMALGQYADGLSFAFGLTPTAGARWQIRYYDDNAWAGLNLIQAYEQTGQPRLLRAAEDILQFERTGKWRTNDPPDEQRYPGGVYWNQARLTRPTHATAGAAQTALELYLVTHDRGDLAFGEQEYRWVTHTLRTPTGWYRDRVEPGGARAGTGEESDQGIMIGDGVLLYRITGNKQYLNQARQTANASVKRFTASVLEDNCPALDAMYFDSLMMLNRVSRFPSGTRLLRAYATWARRHSDPRTGAFTRSYPACRAPLPQAGVTHTLLLQLVG